MRQEPTLHDMAELLTLTRTRPMALWLVEQSETARNLYQKLQAMAQDAGLPPNLEGWEHEALTLHQACDRLLATADGQEASDLLDPTCQHGIAYEPLLNIINARLARGDGDRQQLAAAQRKLQRGAEEERRLLASRRQTSEAVRLLREWLGEAPSLETLAQAIHQLLSWRPRSDAPRSAGPGTPQPDRKQPTER